MKQVNPISNKLAFTFQVFTSPSGKNSPGANFSVSPEGWAQDAPSKGRRSRVRGSIGIFIAAALAACPLYAQSDLEQRVHRLEQIQNNRQQFDNVNQMMQLQETVEQLRGQMEVQERTLQELTNRQQLLYQDLDQRLQALEKSGSTKISSTAPASVGATASATPPASTASATPASVTSTAPATNSAATSPASAASSATNPATSTAPVASNATSPAATSSAPASSNATNSTATTSSASSTPATSILTASDAMQEQAAYQQAYQNLLDKNYDQALIGFNNYLQTYPQGRYRPNAYYWLGEVYLIKNQPQQAQQAFGTVVKEYADNPKAGDALLKLGYSYAALGDNAQAKTTLNEVVQKYPNSAISNLAQTRLAELS
jgi:tol-pal system protein YbgF